MKKYRRFLCVLTLAAILAGCSGNTAATESACDHGPYLELIEELEENDFVAARAILDAMEKRVHNPETETVSPAGATEAIQTQQGEDTAVIPGTSTPPSGTAPDDVTDGQIVELTRHNLLDYFELREDYIFEDPVKCYQSLQLLDGYQKQVAEIRDVIVEISYFDTHAYGELDAEDQLFFADHYSMVTGELAYMNISITVNGEGFISIGEFDRKASCFRNYCMDIVITDVSGKLILK